MKENTRKIQITVKYSEEEFDSVLKQTREAGVYRIHLKKKTPNVSEWIRQKTVK